VACVVSRAAVRLLLSLALAGLAFIPGSAQTFSACIFNSSGAFVSAIPQTLPGNSNPSGLVAGEVNGDGNPDLVVIGYPGGVDGLPKSSGHVQMME
jgi:hypothetical protein